MKPRRHRQLVSFDWAMKRLLRQKSNYAVLEGFLSELLREDITIVSFEDTETNQKVENDKYNRVDILVKDSNEQLILVEIQYDTEADYFHRMLYGASKLITDYMNSGDRYSKVKKVISVNLVYFDLGQGKDYVYQGKTEFHGRHYQDLLELSDRQKEEFGTTYVRDIYPEYYILKINEFNDLAKSNLDEWIYTLKNGSLPKEYKAKGLKEAEEALNVINMDDEEYAAYDRYIEDRRVRESVIGAQEEKLRETEEKLGQTQEKLGEAEEKLGETEEKLGETEEKLGETEEKLQQSKIEHEELLSTALQALIDAGLNESQARQQLGL